MTVFYVLYSVTEVLRTCRLPLSEKAEAGPSPLKVLNTDARK